MAWRLGTMSKFVNELSEHCAKLEAKVDSQAVHCAELEATVDSQARLIEDQHNMLMLKSHSQMIMCEWMGSVQARIRNLEGVKLLDRQYLAEIDKRMEKEVEQIVGDCEFTHAYSADRERSRSRSNRHLGNVD